MQICDRNSPDVNDCLVDAIQEALIKLSDNGLPQLGVPHIDPYFQSEIKIEYKNNQVGTTSIKMAAINNNIKTYYLFYVNFGSLFSYQWEKCKFLWVFTLQK